PHGGPLTVIALFFLSYASFASPPDRDGADPHPGRCRKATNVDAFRKQRRSPWPRIRWESQGIRTAIIAGDREAVLWRPCRDTAGVAPREVGPPLGETASRDIECTHEAGQAFRYRGSRDMSDRSVDVVVVGAGNAAMCAALAAREQGASVLVLERAPREERGGNSTYTAGNIRTAFNGVEDIKTLVPDLTEEEIATTDFGTYTEDEF